MTGLAEHSTATVVGIVPKNSFERLEIRLDEYQGHHLIALRVYYSREGEYLPGRQGVSMRVAALPALIAALQEAEAEAVRRGDLKSIPRNPIPAQPAAHNAGEAA